jgi:prepilin-type N-terminal cleavage/methylation domain-containing protein
MTRLRKDDGFTLVELLVALALMAIIGALVATALRSGRIMLERGQEQEVSGRTDATQSYLRRVLQGMRPTRQPGAPLESSLIEVTPSALTFVTAYTPAGQYQGIYVVILSSRPSQQRDRIDLVEVRTLYRPPSSERAAAPARPSTTTTLIEGAKALQWRYYGARDETSAAAWYPAWTDQLRLPRAIEIDLVWPDGDQRTWSPLIVHIPAAE